MLAGTSTQSVFINVSNSIVITGRTIIKVPTEHAPVICNRSLPSRNT